MIPAAASVLLEKENLDPCRSLSRLSNRSFGGGGSLSKDRDDR